MIKLINAIYGNETLKIERPKVRVGSFFKILYVSVIVMLNLLAFIAAILMFLTQVSGRWSALGYASLLLGCFVFLLLFCFHKFDERKTCYSKKILYCWCLSTMSIYIFSMIFFNHESYIKLHDLGAFIGIILCCTYVFLLPLVTYLMRINKDELPTPKDKTFHKKLVWKVFFILIVSSVLLALVENSQNECGKRENIFKTEQFSRIKDIHFITNKYLFINTVYCVVNTGDEKIAINTVRYPEALNLKKGNWIKVLPKEKDRNIGGISCKDFYIIEFTNFSY